MKGGANFFAIWGGIAGVQSTLPVLLDRRGLDPEQIAHLVAGFAARRFQLPGKGAIEIGNDADFVLVDMAASATLTEQDLFQRHKPTPYMGATFRGVVRRTILRGQTIFKRRLSIADGPPGRFVRPTLPTHAESRTNT